MRRTRRLKLDSPCLASCDTHLLDYFHLSFEAHRYYRVFGQRSIFRLVFRPKAGSTPLPSRLKMDGPWDAESRPVSNLLVDGRGRRSGLLPAGCLPMPVWSHARPTQVINRLTLFSKHHYNPHDIHLQSKGMTFRRPLQIALTSQLVVSLPPLGRSSVPLHLVLLPLA